MTPAAAQPRGSRWSHHRLRLVLGAAFGVNARGKPDTAAVAAALGVSQRTVQRWVHGPARRLVALPAGRLAQIQRAVRPDPESLRQEETAARYARNAVDRVAEPGGAGVLPVWRDRQWLEPHVVAVLELPGLGLRQVAISRESERTLPELRKRGKVISHLAVPSRFHATVLASVVLTELDGWRVQAPVGVVKQGRTQTWLAAAPAVKLSRLAAAQESAPPHRPDPAPEHKAS